MPGLIRFKSNNKEDSTRLVLSEVSIIQTIDPIQNLNILRRCLTFVQTALDIKSLWEFHRSLEPRQTDIHFISQQRYISLIWFLLPENAYFPFNGIYINNTLEACKWEHPLVFTAKTKNINIQCFEIHLITHLLAYKYHEQKIRRLNTVLLSKI